MASIRSTQVGQFLTVKKIAQVSGHNPKIQFLTNHTSHPASNYPKEEDPNRILEVGSKVKVLSKGKAQTKYRQSYVTVCFTDHRNNEFDIFASDLKRHFE